MIIKRPATYSLAGNPIEVAATGSPDQDVFFEVSVDGQAVFTGAAFPFGSLPASLEISDVLRGLLNYHYQPVTDLLTVRADMMAKYALRIWENGAEASAEMIAGLHVLPGGIGRETHRQLKAQGLSYADYRYNNPQKNFFATTRTSGNMIPIRDRELGQLSFPVTGSAVTLTFAGTDGQTVNATVPAGNYGFAVLNLSVLLQQLGNPTVRPYDIAVRRDGVESALSIRIMLSSPTVVPRQLIFRNSLGAYETMDISGEIDTMAEIDTEKGTYLRHTGLGEYENTRGQLEETEYLSGSIGWKTGNELNWIKDMLRSDEVYLSVDGIHRKVLVKATEDIITYRDSAEPGSLNVEIRNTTSSAYAEDGGLFAVSTANWTDFINIWEWMEPTISCSWDNFINVWAKSCVNAYSHAYSKAYNDTSPETPYLKVPNSIWLQQEAADGIQSNVESNVKWDIE